MTFPSVVRETEEWALVAKGHGMPSAPLTAGEKGTLLEWFLNEYPEARQVVGKKAIEHGLLHRLDTGTEGLVLIAKTQEAYASLAEAQRAGLIRKTYFAFCKPSGGTAQALREKPPFAVNSRFRPFGPGRQKVSPLFPGMRAYAEAKTDYETIIEKIEATDNVSVVGITCSLLRGYRHQVRAHLAYLGFPIYGDPLYYPDIPAQADLPLQLYAPGISFPDPGNGVQAVFSLPLPDKMSR